MNKKIKNNLKLDKNKATYQEIKATFLKNKLTYLISISIIIFAIAGIIIVSLESIWTWTDNIGSKLFILIPLAISIPYMAFYLLNFGQKQRQKNQNDNLTYLHGVKENINNQLDYFLKLRQIEIDNAPTKTNKKSINKNSQYDNAIRFLQNSNSKISNKLAKVLENSNEKISEEEKIILRTNTPEDFKYIVNKEKENMEKECKITFKDFYLLNISEQKHYMDIIMELWCKDNKYEFIASNYHLANANLSKAQLPWLDLSHLNLSFANLSHANLSHANLSHTDLSGANLYNLNLSHTGLFHADLSHANLYKANLSHTDLSHADLSKTNLSFANLSHANLFQTNLSEANLYETIFHSTQLSNKKINEIFNFVYAKNIESIYIVEIGRDLVKNILEWKNNILTNKQKNDKSDNGYSEIVKIINNLKK